MKKNFIQMGLMFIAALTLTTNCAKEEVAPENDNEKVVKEAVPFEFTVESIGTKTSTADASTINWVAGDNVNVFHAENGVEPAEYSSNDQFTITSENLAAGKFTGTLQDGALDPAKSYDWYVLYPYSSYISTPANTSAGYTAIGSVNKDTPQVQAGYNSKAHLAGQYFPLYGKVTNVAADAKPTITLNQALAIVKVHVTNSKTTNLTVTDVSFTAPQPITGSYYINFAGATPTFTSSGAGYVSNTANLTVTGGTPIAKDGTADFYIAVKPFTATNGQKLKVAVNGEEKTLTIGASDAVFQPGKIKTVNYSFDADPIIYETAFNYAIDGSSYKNAEAHVASDPGGQTSWGLTYGNWFSSNSAQFRVYSSGGGLGTLDQRFDCSHISYFTFDAGANNDATTLSLTPYYSTNKGEAWTAIGSAIEISTTTTKYKVTMPSDFDRARIKLVVSGSVPTSGDTRLTVDNLKIYGSGAIVADPYISATDVSNVPVVGVTDATLTYSVHNFAGSDDVTASPDNTYVTAATVTSAGTVTYTVAPNYTTSAKNGTITLNSAGNSVSKEINVAQLGETFSVSATTITIPKDAESASFTITTPSFGWEASASPDGGKNLTITSSTSGSGSASAQTITVNSTETAGAEEQTLGTIVIYRNGNDSDPQKKSITIKKASTAVASTYSKVTSISNGTYLICNAVSAKVINGVGDYFPTADVTISGGTTITGDTTLSECEFTITALTGEDVGKYSIVFNNKYVSWNTSTKVSQSNTLTAKGKWTITVDANGLATIQTDDSTAGKYRYWGWYASGNQYRAYQYDTTVASPSYAYAFPTLFKKN